MYILEQTRALIVEIWSITAQMAPYLLFGFLVAGILSVFISPEIVKKHLGKRSIISIIKAALFGVPLPLCSCGVIPVTASLRKSGASKGAVTSFLISTPQTGVDSILVTYSMLGLTFALFRPIIAFVSGIFGGIVAVYSEKDDDDSDEEEYDHVTEELEHSSCCTPQDKNKTVLSRSNENPAKEVECCSAEKHDEYCTADCCDSSEKKPETSLASRISAMFHYGFVVLFGDIAISLTIGIILAGAISYLIPANWIESTIGQNYFLSMGTMLILGIPLYVCATSSVPIAAVLVAKGISPGAALVFLMTGPATNAATLSAIWKILGRKQAILYLSSIAVCALASGFLMDAFYEFIPGINPVKQMHEMAPGIFQHICGVVLLLLILQHFFKGSKLEYLIFEETHKVETDSQKVYLTVKNVTCQHCKGKIEDAVKKLPGVKSVTVEISDGMLTAVLCDDSETGTEQIIEEIGKAGYKASVV